MPKRTKRDQEQQNASLNSSVVQQKSTGTASPFVDNRSSTVKQQELQETATNSPQVQKATQLQAMADQQSPMMETSSFDDTTQLKEAKETSPMQSFFGEPVAQRALMVGSYNEKKDIKDLGLWWVMACEYVNSKLADPDLEPILLTLKDLNRDVDQEFEMAVGDKLRFITHGNPGGDTVTNETETGKGEGIWAQHGMDLKNESWTDIRDKILGQVEVYNENQEQVSTNSLLKPYFCFMKENQDIMDYHDGNLDEIGEGPVFITNHYVLALDMGKVGNDYSQALAAKNLDMFTPGLGWKTFDDMKAKFPLLTRYKNDEEVDETAMYQEIYNVIAPQYDGLVKLAKEAQILSKDASENSPWEHIKNKLQVDLSPEQQLE